MKTIASIIITTILFPALSAFTTIDAPTWDIDNSHSSVSFSVNHFLVPVDGRFNNFEGAVKLDKENLLNSSANFTIDVASVDTRDDKRNNHLQSGDFFNAKKFPKITFVSNKFEDKGNGELLVHGKLTIKDVTKDVALPFKILGQTEHPMKKGTIISGIQLKTTINRNDYGVGSGSWAASAVVGDEVDIKVTLELSRKS
ncbi:MAG: YceI family protein [Flavobacteriales bacterium]|jgi:polyisoprenoid-binding protein YceI|nr:YceI family protein [Flavobacteriales bacterium]